MSITSLVNKSTKRVQTLKSGKQACYIRNSEWLSNPLTSSDEKCVILLAIQPNIVNYIAFTATVTSGTFNVDWGDGNSTNGTASNTTVYKSYDYAAVSGSPTSSGYKQVIITITPSVAGALQYIDVLKKHTSETGTTGIHNILEIKASGSNFAQINQLGGGSLGTTGIVVFPLLENVEILNGSISTHNYTFNTGCPRLKRYYFNSRTNMTGASGDQWLGTFYNCFALISFEFISPNGGIWKPYSVNQSFYGCYDLINIPYVDLSSLTSLGSAALFNFCYALEYVNPLTISSSLNTGGSLFVTCHCLKELSLTQNTTTNFTLANSCNGLTYVELINNNTAQITISGNNALKTLDLTFNGSNLSFPSISSSNNLRVINAKGSGTIAKINVNAVYNLETINGTLNFGTITTATAFFAYSKLKTLPTINYSTIAASQDIYFGGDFLESIPGTFNNSNALAGLTIYQSSSLKEIPAFNAPTFSGGSYYYPNLTSFLPYGMAFNFTLLGAQLSQSALEIVFENLAKPASVRTFTLTYNPGADTAFALNGTTTTGSTTITMANTSGILADMQVTGTGISTNRAVTFTDVGDIVTFAGHGIPNGTRVSFSSITSTTGITTYTMYYVINATTDTFQLSLTNGGSAIALTTNGSGNMSLLTKVVSVVPNTSITVDIPAFSSATNSLTFRKLKTQIALMKNWAVTG